MKIWFNLKYRHIGDSLISGGCPTGRDWILYGGTCFKFKTSRGPLSGDRYTQATAVDAETACQSDSEGQGNGF